MAPTRRIERIGPAVAFFFAAFVLLFGLGRHGIWDPTELSFADTLRTHGAFPGNPPWHGVLVRRGFATFGVHDWSGRAFGAVACLAVVAVAMGIARRHADARTAAYAGVLSVATPLLVLNGRWMVGDAAALATHSLVGLGVFMAAFPRSGAERPETSSLAMRVLGLVIALAAGAAAVMVRGALLGVLPPLLAVAGVILIEPRPKAPYGGVRAILAAGGVALLGTIAYLVLRDLSSYSVLIGGVPGQQPPNPFEKFLQVAFHTLAPTSAVFVLGAARSVVGDGSADGTPASDDEDRADGQRVRLALALWATFAWGAAALFASRYGTSNFLGVVPVAVLAAITLREAEIGRPIELGAALIAAMLLGLLIRDFALYPAAPLAGVPVPPPTLAPDFQPRAAWALLLGAFAATFFFGAASRLTDDWPSLRERRMQVRAFFTGRFVPAVRERRLLQLGLAVALLAEVALVVIAVAGARLGMASIVVRVVRILCVGLPAAPALLWLGVELACRAFSRLGGARMLPAVLVAGAIGLFIQGPFLVALSNDLSPREVYDTYNRLRGPNDVLIEFNIESRSSAYYASGRVTRVTSEDQLVAQLRGPGRRWALLRRNLLPEFDGLYRTATGKHVIVADATNSEVVLATNAPIPGHPDQNPIASAIRTGPVRPQYPVGTRLENLELVGYDLELPNGDSVGAGQSFRITWYWKVLSPMQLNWRVFVHIDGAGLRLNGDHDPVEGLLPTRQWVVGDIVADTQELAVPPTYPAQPFTIYLGLYTGETRMQIVSGNHTNDDRIVAGTLSVR